MTLIVLAAVVLGGCGPVGSDDGPGRTFRIVSGSENETLEPIVQRYADRKDVTIEVDYQGSVDIMLGLEDGEEFAYDAVWPANSMWIALGDTQSRVQAAESILRSPVVMGVKRSVAERLGWVGAEVRVADILAAAERGDLRFMMTSATQSNSGASAYLGFLSAFAGGPEVLTVEHLQDPAVRERIVRILGTVDRSSGSSGWLKDLFLERYDDFDAMVNYEAVVIEANQELVGQGREPLYAVYPVDGLAIADSPLGYVDRGDAEQRALFDGLQGYLLSEEVQGEILAQGRRVGPVGLAPTGADPAVFNPDWGIDLNRVISPIRFPPADVTRQALDLYQTTFRKPSFTVLAVDFSGSMEGAGEEQLKRAMRTLLDQGEAARYLLQASPGDITVVIPFNGAPLEPWLVEGNDPAALTRLLGQVEGLSPTGGTNIYDPVAEAFDLFAERGVGGHFPAVILMTDGQSNEGSFDALRARLEAAGRAEPALAEVPVYGILFGDASTAEVEEVATLTGGRVFDGRDDLISAFRQAKGYN